MTKGDLRVIKRNVWLSFDVEATGPVPGRHSMLSLGICAFHETDGVFSNLKPFECNIRPLDDCEWDPQTSVWWAAEERRVAFERTTMHPQEPLDAMKRLMTYLESLPSDPHVWAAYPATFDMPFVRYYAQRFQRERWVSLYNNPIERIACFDIGSYAMQLLQCDYHEISKKRMPAHWTSYENPLPHVALNDAAEQAHLLRTMLLDARSR